MLVQPLFFLLIAIALVHLSIQEEQFNTKPAKKQNKSPATGGSQKWNSLNFDNIEKKWEEGDEGDELEMEFERVRKIQASKQPKFDMNDGAAIRRAVETDPFAFAGSGGSMMIFVTLLKSKTWSSVDIDALAKKYAGLLRSGSISANTYNIGDGGLMVHVDKSWYTKDTLQFFARQPEVESFSANSKTYYPKDFLGDDEDADF